MNHGSNTSSGKRFFLSQEQTDQFWGSTVLLLEAYWGLFPQK